MREDLSTLILGTLKGAIMKIILPVLAAAVLLAGCSRGAGPAPVTTASGFEILTPYGPPTRPFSPAARVGNLIILSGQIGTSPDAAGGVVSGGIEAETRQTMENIRDVLTRVGSSLDRVVKCTIMMADMAEWGRMNSVYATFFPTHKPARSAFGTSGLALNARVEIECIAVAGDPS